MSFENIFLGFIAAFGSLMAILFVVTSRSGRRPPSQADPLASGALRAARAPALDAKAAQRRSRPGRIG